MKYQSCSSICSQLPAIFRVMLAVLVARILYSLGFLMRAQVIIELRFLLILKWNTLTSRARCLYNTVIADGVLIQKAVRFTLNQLSKVVLVLNLPWSGIYKLIEEGYLRILILRLQTAKGSILGNSFKRVRGRETLLLKDLWIRMFRGKIMVLAILICILEIWFLRGWSSETRLRDGR